MSRISRMKLDIETYGIRLLGLTIVLGVTYVNIESSENDAVKQKIRVNCHHDISSVEKNTNSGISFEDILLYSNSDHDNVSSDSYFGNNGLWIPAHYVQLTQDYIIASTGFLNSFNLGSKDAGIQCAEVYSENISGKFIFFTSLSSGNKGPSVS